MRLDDEFFFDISTKESKDDICVRRNRVFTYLTGRTEVLIRVIGFLQHCFEQELGRGLLLWELGIDVYWKRAWAVDTNNHDIRQTCLVQLHQFDERADLTGSQDYSDRF